MVMDRVRLAVGFRHGHVFSLYDLAQSRRDVEVVAACEEDEATRAQLAADGKVRITHSSYLEMLDAVPCDAVAVGDYFGVRGAQTIEALRRGKHVISDKPICTSLAELDQIEAIAKAKGRASAANWRVTAAPLEARRRILTGEIGSVHTIIVTGQHPLRLPSCLVL